MLDNLGDYVKGGHDVVPVRGVLLVGVIELLGLPVPLNQELGANVELADAKVDHVMDVLVRNASATVDDQRALGHLVDGLQNVEVDVSLGLVLAVVGANCNCKGIDIGLVNELNRLGRLGETNGIRVDNDTILGSANRTKLCLDGSAGTRC